MTIESGQESIAPQNQTQKIKGALSVIHLVAGSGLVVKGIIIACAFVAGYGSVIYFHGRNIVSSAAEEVVRDETGFDMKFSEYIARFSPE